jgi:tripartite-type tricarboxylate transporter receptor subunit TctC
VWFGLFAPAGTPAAIVERLNKEVADILKDSAFVDKLNATGATPLINTPPEMKTFVSAEVEKWVKVARDSGAKAD